MAAEQQRPDGWVVSYVVEVVFDTNARRTRYDHVGTVARCTGCGDWLDVGSSPAALARHARRHEPTASVTPRRDTNSGDRPHPVASLRGEEVTPELTTD